MISLQNAMAQVGNAGIYQARVFAVFSCVIFIIACQIMSPTYTYITPPFLCDGKPCQANEDTCKTDIVIDRSYRYKNIVSDFKLYCDKEFLISVGGSISFLGSVLGGILMSYLADRKGRRITFIVSWIGSTVGFIGIFLSLNVQMLFFFTFIMGFFEIGNYVLISVILNEICGPRMRQIYCLLILVIWSLGEIIIAVFYYFIDDWRKIELWIIAMPATLCLVFVCFLDETPKYLYSKGRLTEAMAVLNKIARINGKPELVGMELQEQSSDMLKAALKSYTFTDLFRFASLRMPSVGFFLISYILHLVYYAGQFGLKDIVHGRMVYLMGVVLGVTEMLAYGVTTVVIHRIRRKFALQISFILSIIGCFIFLSYGLDTYHVDCEQCAKEKITIALLCLIRIVNTLGFGIQGLYSNEFYPTPIRAIGSGFLFSAGILGSFTAPYVTMIGKLMRLNPFVIIGFVSMLGSLGTQLTVETKGKQMKDHIDEEVQNKILVSDEEIE